MHIQEYKMDYSILEGHKIVPVVVFNNLEEVIPNLTALKNGGIKCAEITFRTACAEDAIKLAIKELGNEMVIGAGTVINAEQANKAIDAGVKFIVSPGYSEKVADVCIEKGIPYLPGIATPTEIMAAKEKGLSFLKFFPAEAFGGTKTLKAMASAFPGVMFLPTGGIGANNMMEYMNLKFVKAIGGSWMMKGTPKEIEQLTREAINKMENE